MQWARDSTGWVGESSIGGTIVAFVWDAAQPNGTGWRIRRRGHIAASGPEVGDAGRAAAEAEVGRIVEALAEQELRTAARPRPSELSGNSGGLEAHAGVPRPPHPTKFAPDDTDQGRTCMVCGHNVPGGYRYVHAAWHDAGMPDFVTPADVARMVDGVRAEAGESEGAHAGEDAMLWALVEAIAEGRCEEPAAACREALASREIKFSRWYC